MSGAGSIAQLRDIMQMAYVPGDFEKAFKLWTRRIGAGPFFSLEHVKLEHGRYRGEPVEIDFSIMLGYWGDMQIELIPQHNQAPSIFKDWPMTAKKVCTKSQATTGPTAP